MAHLDKIFFFCKKSAKEEILQEVTATTLHNSCELDGQITKLTQNLACYTTIHDDFYSNTNHNFAIFITNTNSAIKTISIINIIPYWKVLDIDFQIDELSMFFWKVDNVIIWSFSKSLIADNFTRIFFKFPDERKSFNKAVAMTGCNISNRKTKILKNFTYLIYVPLFIFWLFLTFINREHTARFKLIPSHWKPTNIY